MAEAGVMQVPRIVIVHSFMHARDALAAAQALHRPIALQSATGAIRFAGGQYLLTMFQKAHALFPDVKAIFILDCDDAGAETISAMRIGHTHIRSSAAPPTRAKLVDIAKQLGVVVVDGPWEALDLRYSYDVPDACRKWLQEA